MNWVEASLSFPTFPRFCGQTFLEAKDRELAHACVLAYNDWMVEEWCGDSGGRLIPLSIVPLWDAELAAAEVRRNAARGVRAVCFSEIPPHLGLPSIHSGYWDPFFAACEETRHRRLHAHRLVVEDAGDVGRRAGRGRGHAELRQRDGVADRLPVLGRARALPDAEARVHRGPDRLDPLHPRAGRRRVARAPGVGRREGHRPRAAVDVLLPQVFGCFFRDRHGLESLDRVGVDNITFETDYPHTDSTWPDTKQVAEEHDGRISPDDVVYKIVRGNAIRMLVARLDVTMVRLQPTRRAGGGDGEIEQVVVDGCRRCSRCRGRSGVTVAVET